VAEDGPSNDQAFHQVSEITVKSHWLAVGTALDDQGR